MPLFLPRWHKPVFLLVVALILVPLTKSQPSSQVSFHPPAGVLVAGLRETATHRSPGPTLRITSDPGMPSQATLWLHLDAAGRVLEVRNIETEGFFAPHYDPKELIEGISKVTYIPFARHGRPVEAWAQEKVELLVREDPAPLHKAVTPFPDMSSPLDFSIRLSRSGCYGFCPAYSVTISGDGTVSYQGGRSVSIAGEHAARVSPETARQLLDDFRKANFFDVQSEYRAHVTDNPVYRLELRVGTTRKTVTDYVGQWVGMPAAITQLEDAVDQAADSARWVTASSQTLLAMRDAGISASSREANQILRRAVFYGKPEATRELLAAGVPTTWDGDNKGVVEKWTSFESLLEAATRDSGDAKSRTEVMAALLANPAIRADKQGIQRALGSAATQGQFDTARMLIAAGADPQALFQDNTNQPGKPADQTYLMCAVKSGVWSEIDDALSRPHDIHAVDRDGRSALAQVTWTSFPAEDIFPIVDKLISAGAGTKELDRALADACERPEWRDGLVARGANPQICTALKK
jgi:hypothetical protein